MKKLFFGSLLVVLVSCSMKTENQTLSNSSSIPEIEQDKNLIKDISKESLNGFNWLNPIKDFIATNNSLIINAPAKSDYFNNPENGTINATAPILYKEISGDFVATCLVKPDFKDMWNAASLMVFMDSTHWIKYAFENSDATGKSIVSVVTREVSDDANGAILNEHNAIWLKMVRKGDLYSMHWSINGKDYKMTRVCRMPHYKSVKIGIEAQCPIGDGAKHEFLFFSIESKTVKDFRLGQ